MRHMNVPFAHSSWATASLWSPIFRCMPRRTPQGMNVRGGDTGVEVQVRRGVGHLLSEMVSGVEELVRSDMRPAVTTEAQSRCPAIRTSTRRGGADGRSTSFMSLRRSTHDSLRRGVRRRRRPSGEVVLFAPAAAVVADLRGDQSGSSVTRFSHASFPSWPASTVRTINTLISLSSFMLPVAADPHAAAYRSLSCHPSRCCRGTRGRWSSSVKAP